MSRILVVDDEPLVLRSFVRILRGHEVVCCRSADEARETLDGADPFDVIFCDLRLCGEDGSALFDSVSEAAQKSFIFFSGASAFDEQVRELEARVGRPILMKPVAPALVRALADGDSSGILSNSEK